MTSTFELVCNAWATELTSTVDGLQSAVVHKYAPWSVEELGTLAGERHLAIWPQLEAEEASPLTATISGGEDLMTQVYSIMVWEDASDTTTRLQDDDTDNLTWLQLAEDIRGRLYAAANFQLGSTTIMQTRYLRTAFQRAGSLRVMEILFRVQYALGWA